MSAQTAADDPARPVGGVVDRRGHSGRLGAHRAERRRHDDGGARRAARARRRVAAERAVPDHLGLVRDPRRDRPRRLRHRLPGPRREPEPRGRAQGHPAAPPRAAEPGPGAERGAAAGPAEPSRTWSGSSAPSASARTWASRWSCSSGRTLEELVAQQGPFNAREAMLVGVDICCGLAAVHGARLRARRRQGAERDAGRRRPHGADGLRRRLRREDRRSRRAAASPARRCTSRPRSSPARARTPRRRHLQRRRPALLPRHRAPSRSKGTPAPRCGASTRRGAPRRRLRDAAARPARRLHPAWSNGPPRRRPRIAIRPPASWRPP